MSTAVQKALSFEEKLKDRLRQGIGELMSDEDLQAIIDNGIQQVFFEPRPRKDGHGYRERTVYDPPLIEETLRKELADSMDRCVAKWLRDNHDTVLEKIDEAVVGGAGDMLVRALTALFGPALGNCQEQMFRAMDDKIRGIGQ